ncbi:hypothetical protein BDP55DRAFT_417759 [Colletotrichum godetiae]|uniref:Uncharacterized protein n=1 Tax=Colletotrichum godetiae TaxID=1209918 RepID=A0AAJ0ABE0_9PEZI|nr:uncharacterized protein BDP55DRAFT_417759 [Colletotrichum godetiae]KAK1657880.1 hypothetical protein BDP55DRAFT_417759 [Colletotrichum godetiae]
MPLASLAFPQRVKNHGCKCAITHAQFGLKGLCLLCKDRLAEGPSSGQGLAVPESWPSLAGALPSKQSM